METKYIIYDVNTNRYFYGLDDKGKPCFTTIKYELPFLFEFEELAINRLKVEIQLWSPEFLKDRIIEIKKVYLF